MIKSCVTISLVPSLAGGPWIYWDDLEISIPKAKAAGFDAVELFTASADAVTPHKLAQLLDENSIELAAVGTGAGKALHGLHLVSTDSQIRRKARDFIRAMIDFASAFHAPTIIGSMQGSLEQGALRKSRKGRCAESLGQREQALAWLAESLDELGQKAADHNLNLILEPLNRYETDLINTLAEGVTLIKSLKARNVSLLADLFHMNIEEQSIAESILAAGCYIGHVHFVDSNRRPAGTGHIDLNKVAQALSEIGFDGYASAEALPWPDPDTAAAQTMSAFRKFLV